MSELDDIHAEFADPIIYTPHGGDELAITAVRSDLDGMDLGRGGGDTVRQIDFEVRKADLPDRPTKQDLIVDSIGSYRVINIVDRPEIAAWQLSVEESVP